MYEIKHIDVWVTTRYTTLFGFLTSLVGSGLSFLMYVVIELRIFNDYAYRYSRIDLEEIIPFFLAPLIFAFLSFVGTAVFCALYNVIAERTQGLQVDLEFLPEEDSKDKNV